MKKEKIFYETPVSETLVIRFEDSILQVLSPVQVIGLTTPLGGGDQGFGESAASIEDKSNESWW